MIGKMNSSEIRSLLSVFMPVFVSLMPIQPSLYLPTVSDDDFATIDRTVMECAYAVHNKFGRLFDERVYENALAASLRAEGFEVHTQVPILVTHNSFQKTYYLDLVVDDMIYELKVVDGLTNEHEAQALNYAMLQNVRLVKLINFGEKKVRGKLLSNAVMGPERYEPEFSNSGMRFFTPHCKRLLTHLEEVVHDLGTHLSSRVYNEILIHLFGGEAHCLRRTQLQSGQLILGTHIVQVHADGYAFIVTSISTDPSAYLDHLRALLLHSRLNSIHWINFNRSRIEIRTLDSKLEEVAGE
jgi:GxxExxY protein